MVNLYPADQRADDKDDGDPLQDSNDYVSHDSACHKYELNRAWLNQLNQADKPRGRRPLSDQAGLWPFVPALARQEVVGEFVERHLPALLTG